VQVFAVHMVVHADDPPLEDAEIALDGVGVDIPVHILLFTMTDNAMSRKIFESACVGRKIVGHYLRGLIDVLHDDRPEIGPCHPLNGPGDYSSVSFHQGKYRRFVFGPASSLAVSLSPYVSFVGFYSTG